MLPGQRSIKPSAVHATVGDTWHWGAVMHTTRKQSGLSMLWFLFVVVVALITTVVGFRVLPAYIEYFSVQKALQESLRDVRDLNATSELRRNFQKKADAGYIESVDGRDIEVKKVGNEFVANVSWTRKLHLVGNASLLLEFDAVASR